MADRHQDIERLLDEYVDGALDDLRARAVRGHLRACTACSLRVDSTRRYVAVAQALPAFEAPDALWGRIAAGLDADEDRLAGRGRLFWLWQGLRQHLLLCGGVLSAAAVAVLLVTLHGRTPLKGALQAVKIAPSPEVMYEDALREVEHADADYQTAVADLRAIAHTERDRWKPEVQTAFDQNLAVIDSAVASQSKLARSSPGDVAVADALADSYRKEIDFLQSAVIRGSMAQ